MPFTLIRQDITQMKVDAVVNAANTQLKMGGGVCGAIFSAAGEEELQAACDLLSPIPTGGAVMTPGFGMNASYIIHAAGPVWDVSRPELSEQLLRAAYANALRLAAERDLKSIAFPLISSGIYGYPKDEALRVATAEIRGFLEEHEMDVYLAVFDRESFRAGRELFGRIDSYIDEHYAEVRMHAQSLRSLSEAGKELPLSEHPAMHSSCIEVDMAAAESIPMPYAAPEPQELQGLLDGLDEPFSSTLLRLIDSKGRTDVEVYKRANIDHKLFSKIRGGKGYMPGKRTVIALSIALELSLKETEGLLKQAGYALSSSRMSDVIVEFFIKNGRYDIFEINEALFYYDQPLLGG